MVLLMHLLAIFAPIPSAMGNQPVTPIAIITEADTVYHYYPQEDHHTKFLHVLESLYAKALAPNHAVTWSTNDLIQWQLQADDSHLLRKKADFIKGYANVFVAAANEFDLPPVLVAGIAWREFGGDPMWIDDLAYKARALDHSTDQFCKGLTLTSNPLETSFGNVSIQIRRAATALGYDVQSLTPAQHAMLVEALKDPVYNIFIAAKHLADLRDIDFAGSTASSLTPDELLVVATRYNRGPELTLQEIQANTCYGRNIFKREILLTQLLHPTDSGGTQTSVASIGSRN
jgi:hypothetical protein